MDDIIAMSGTAKALTNADELVRVSDDLLLDVKTDINQVKNISMPITQLAALGAGVSSLIPAFRTVTETTTVATKGLYRWVNEGGKNALKIAKTGNAWGAYKTGDGASKMAQFQKVDSLTGTKATMLPVDPATMFIAVALFSIEKQLGDIAEKQKEILSFLEREKESEIEADVETLSNIICKYKHNWDNATFIKSNHKLVLDIQRTARKNMLSYQKKVKDVLSARKGLVLQSAVQNTLNQLEKDFKYYRLCLFAFAMSSLTEIMLSENFERENILSIQEEAKKQTEAYASAYEACSQYLNEAGKSSVEVALLKGVGATSNAVGKLIGNIPKIKDGQVDEFLLESGKKVSGKAEEKGQEKAKEFEKMSDPGTELFIVKMQELMCIYNDTTEICFDKDNIYLIAG